MPWENDGSHYRPFSSSSFRWAEFLRSAGGYRLLRDESPWTHRPTSVDSDAS